MTSQKKWVACLVTIDILVSQLDEVPQELSVVDGDIKFTPARSADQIRAIYEDDKEKRSPKQIKREQFQGLFGKKSKSEIVKLFKKAKQLAEKHTKETDRPMLAGNVYGEWLHEAYDPHSKFLPKEALYPKAREFFGIGAHLAKYESDNEKLNGTVSFKPLAGSPASKAGLRTGDLLLEVDGYNIQETGVNEIVDRIVGELDTVVELKVFGVCEQAEKVIRIKRGPITTASDWLKDSKFVSLSSHNEALGICSGQKINREPVAGEPQALYIPMTSFSARRGQSLCGEFSDLLERDLANKDSQGIILDLRGNPGGLLNEVACMLDQLIGSDQVMIGQVPVELGKIVADRPNADFYFREEGYFDIPESNGVYNKKVTVLTDRGSASASEIFAGVIQDMKRGWVVGDRTHGKGSVQTIREHSAGLGVFGALLQAEPLAIGYTTAIYTLPSGRSPQRVGILPDFRFDYDGQEIVIEDDKAGEELLHNSIVYEQPVWRQTRQDEVDQISSCIKSGESVSQSLADKIAADERYGRPLVSNFVTELAKDIMRCSSGADSQ